MPKEFHPSFKNFQQDIEQYLTSLGKRQRRKDGITIFRGYFEAEKSMFRLYLDHQAFDPLVVHFRNWNWETGYNDYLFEITAALVSALDWPRLQRLWDGVIARRKKFYNEVWKIEKDNPGTLPSKTVNNSKNLLLETLERVKMFAENLGEPGDATPYTTLIGRVQRGRKA